MGKSHPIQLKPLPSDLTPDRLPPSLFESPHFVLLESSCGGRFSIAAWEPRVVLTSDSHDFFERLRHALREFPTVDAPDLPFAGGWIGYLGYELYSEIEKKVPPREPDLIPKAVFCYYDRFYLYDHLKRTPFSVLVANASEGRDSFRLLRDSLEVAEDRRGGRLGSSLGSSRSRLQQRAVDDASGESAGGQRLAIEAAEPPVPTAATETSPPPVSSNFKKEDYLATIDKIKSYITAGDCYQVNLSQQFSCPVSESPYSIYQRLRSVSPSPYAAFLNLGGAQILSSSPECFLEVDRKQVVTRPIKGTRPRGATPAADGRLAGELEGSQKDRAELLMITDLERNDLGRVCRPGSVTVDELQRIESYAQVHHLVSTIRGELDEGKGIVDLLRATFPGGSITGAPKIRAMQIIRELEPSPRNVYCGAIGFIGQNGKAQFNIAIRTMVLKNNQATFWGGGGIVADSDPEMEYQETLVKAQGMIGALRM